MGGCFGNDKRGIPAKKTGPNASMVGKSSINMAASQLTGSRVLPEKRQEATEMTVTPAEKQFLEKKNTIVKKYKVDIAKDQPTYLIKNDDYLDATEQDVASSRFQPHNDKKTPLTDYDIGEFNFGVGASRIKEYSFKRNIQVA